MEDQMMFDDKMGAALANLVADREPAQEPPEQQAETQEPQGSEQQPAVETQAQPETPATEPEKPKVEPEQQPAAPADWKESIKDVPLAELLKLKGLDEKLVKLYDLYEKTGDLSDYFKVYNTDYDKLSDIDIKKMQVQEKYSMLSPEEQAEMVEAELEQYQLDPELYDEKVVRRNQLKLKADVAAFRETLKQKQAEALIPKADVASRQGQQSQHSEAEAVKEYVQMLQGSDVFKTLSEKGTITVGEGETAFNMDLDTQAALSFLTDAQVAAKHLSTPDGKPDFQKQLLQAAVALDPKGFIAKLGEHYRKLEKIALAKELGNEQPPAAAQVAAGQPKSGAQLMAEMMPFR